MHSWSQTLQSHNVCCTRHTVCRFMRIERSRYRSKSTMENARVQQSSLPLQRPTARWATDMDAGQLICCILLELLAIIRTNLWACCLIRGRDSDSHRASLGSLIVYWSIADPQKAKSLMFLSHVTRNKTKSVPAYSLSELWSVNKRSIIWIITELSEYELCRV